VRPGSKTNRGTRARVTTSAEDNLVAGRPVTIRECHPSPQSFLDNGRLIRARQGEGDLAVGVDDDFHAPVGLRPSPRRLAGATCWDRVQAFRHLAERGNASPSEVTGAFAFLASCGSVAGEATDLVGVAVSGVDSASGLSPMIGDSSTPARLPLARPRDDSRAGASCYA
jgi:hypothetical protein